MKPDFSFTLNNFTTDVFQIPLEKIFFDDSFEETLFVFDKNTWQAYAELAGDNVSDKLSEFALILDTGEKAKTWKEVELILAKAFERKFSRQAKFVGIGGGVITDITAFAGSLFMRGCSVKLVPTTLLSMVDAAFGGKTGINYYEYKNMVGSFYPAEQLVISTTFLKTLPNGELKSGLAEVIKHGMLDDEELLNIIEQKQAAIYERDLDVLSPLVERSLKVKGKVVEQDLREKGIRAHLNMGHTFGHALEAATGFSRYSHGEAVAWGLRCALDAGKTMGITDLGYAERIESILDQYEYMTHCGDSHLVDPILEAMSMDKKKQGSIVRFVLQRNLGSTQVLPLDMKLVREIVKERC